MSNKDIAIKFAKEMLEESPGFVYSDKFFQPFGKGVRHAIIRELDKIDIIAWSDTKQGAFLFHKNDNRLAITELENHKGAVWTETVGDTPRVMILPILETA